jgi:hypothetical protein
MMAAKFIQKAVAKMKSKGTLGKFGKATDKKIAAGKKAGGVKKKEAVFAQNMKKIAAKHKDHAGRGGKREAKGHDAIGSHEGYSMPMKKKK